MKKKKKYEKSTKQKMSEAMKNKITAIVKEKNDG